MRAGRQIAVALVALLFSVPAPRASGGEKSTPAPVIRCEPEEFDFGKALPGRTLRKEFTLRNAGDAELLIDGVSTSCGCTAAIAGARQLAPGRTTPLTVTLETRNSRGRLEKRVVVRSNDPATPLLEVKVVATVEPPPARR
jgi:hypothetical protein